MKWFNKPLKWSVKDNVLIIDVEPSTDYWQVTHYGFERDNGPFYYQEADGNFEASVKITGQYQEMYHQAGLMIRLNEKSWIKTGIEFVNGAQNVSAVVTHTFSDWSVVPTSEHFPCVWLKLLRKGDCVEINYSFDDNKYQMLRLAYFQPNIKAQIGLFAAAPGKEGFSVMFEDFKIQPKQ